MEQKIKLKPKQLAQISQIQQQKQQLNKMFQDLNEREGSILELILEDNDVTEPVASAKLEEGMLVLAFQEKKVGKKAVKKASESKD